MSTKDDLIKEIQAKRPDYVPSGQAPETNVRTLKISSMKDSFQNFEQYTPEWIDYSSVETNQQGWFWQDVIPNSQITLFAGVGGVGKSTLLLEIIAKTTTGQEFMCCGERVQFNKGSVILMSAEDDPETQIVPKLKASNADLSKVLGIRVSIGNLSKKKLLIRLDKDLSIIEEKIEKPKDVRLLVIDPITYFLGDVEDHKHTLVANFLLSLIELAKKYEIAIIINKHLRKRKGGVSTTTIVDEVGGSAAWVNTPRQAWAILEHPEDPKIKLMFNIKSNNSERSLKALNFQIKTHCLFSGVKTVVLEWGDKLLDITADEAVSKESFEKSKAKLAQEIIYTTLKTKGCTRIKVLQELCQSSGVGDRTTRSAYTLMIKEKTVIRLKNHNQPTLALNDELSDYK